MKPLRVFFPRIPCPSWWVATLLAFWVVGSHAFAKEGAPPPKVTTLEIVDRAITFHGGELYRASESELDVCSRSGCFHVRARIDGDLFEYEVSQEKDGQKQRARLTNRSAERFENGKALLAEPRAVQDWIMGRVYFAFLPYRLNDPSVYKEDLGLETWEGRSLHKVKITFAPGSSSHAQDEYLYWLDPASGRVEQFAYSYDTSNKGLRFRRGINYRRQGGILFFDHENYGVEGDDLTVDQITPAFVAEKMRLVSTVELRDVAVRPLSR